MFKRAKVSVPHQPKEVSKKEAGRPNYMPELLRKGYTEQLIINGFMSYGLTQRESTVAFETAIKGIYFKESIKYHGLTDVEILNIKARVNRIAQIMPQGKEDYLEIFK